MRFPSLLAASLLLTSACAHQSQLAKPAEPLTPVAVAPRSSGTPVAAAEQACKRDNDCDSKSLCIRDRCVPVTPENELAECSHLRVHFDFDAWTLRDEDRPRLERVARCLRADQKLHVTVEGNADERGTEEYNLQLGSKRASQVERYLQAFGVSEEQLKVISYGFERPLCTEHDEACWAQNRRASVKAQASSH